MGTPLGNSSINTAVRKVAAHTLTGLKRWSCIRRDLPGISEVKAIHVYDFDNTLFKSPLPNSKLWASATVGFLQNEDCFTNGGWWHDHHILEATGEGAEKEELRAWEGWWNEYIVELVTLSLQQKDALTVLLTGRKESNFAGIIKKIIASKNLSFDMICLKPQAGPNGQLFSSTMTFKQALLRDLLYTYKDADEIKVYEDRMRHVDGFRRFFETFNKMLISSTPPHSRKPVTAEVVEVAELATTLDPVVETAEVQRMINTHNAGAPLGSRYEIKRIVFYTGYLFSAPDTAKLLTFVNLPPGMAESDVRFFADKILITPRMAPTSILKKVGGIGHKQTWQVTGTAFYDHKVWAARVAPIPPTATYHTDNPTPIVILALRKDARPSDANRIQNWQSLPTEKQYIFQTVVGEKMQLRIERDGDGEADNENPQRILKRRYGGLEEPQSDRDSYRPAALQNQRSGYGNDENRRPGQGGGSGSYRGGNQNRGRGGGNGPGGGNLHRYPSHTSGRGGRGGGGGGPGRGGGGNRGRGRGGYKSLDDVGSNTGRYGAQGFSYQHAQQYQPNYDDGPSHDGRGGEAYNLAFPQLGPGGGGLPYGK